MVVKLLCTKPTNFIGFVAKGFLKRRFSNFVPEQKNNYQYFLVLDFEATCERKKKITQEIIEFPCLKINVSTLQEEARFHQYVRPVLSPILSNFCVELTGIFQEVVDESLTFPEVYTQFEKWRIEEGLTEKNSLYITSGDWDLGHMMKVQCLLSGIERPSHMLQWADLKKLFGNNEPRFYNSFVDIMGHYGLQFVGRPHSGIDDCLNMVRVIKEMVQAGIEFKPTSQVDAVTAKVINLTASTQSLKLKDVPEEQSKTKVVG